MTRVIHHPVRGVAVLVALALVFGACGGGGDDAGTVESSTTTAGLDPIALAEGKRFFEGTCAACHGFDAQGIEGLGRPLVGSTFVAERTDAEMIAFLQEGRTADHPDNITGVAMPPRGGNNNLTDRDLGDIVVFLRSIGGPASG